MTKLILIDRLLLRNSKEFVINFMTLYIVFLQQYSVEDKQRYREFRDVTPLEHSKSSEKRPSGQHHSKRSEKGDAEGADKGRNISSTSHKEGVHKDGDSTSGDTKDKKGAEKQKGQLFDEVTASEGDKQLAVGEKIQSTG